MANLNARNYVYGHGDVAVLSNIEDFPKFDGSCEIAHDRSAHISCRSGRGLSTKAGGVRSTLQAFICQALTINVPAETNNG
jgi:hypothetical protein